MSNARNLANLLGTGTAVPSAKMPSGSILQVVTATTDNQQSLSPSTSWADITGLPVNITPTATSNKILVMGHISHYVKDKHQAHFYVKRGSTIVARGDADGARFRTLVTAQGNNDYYSDWVVKNTPFWFMDNPATSSAVSYQVGVIPGVTNSNNIYINRSSTDRAQTGYDFRAVSNITAWEVSA